MFCLKPLQAFPPDILPGEEIFRKWTVSADFWAMRSKHFLTRKSGGNTCILCSEHIITVSKKSMFYLLHSYTHLLHSFVAETHYKLSISLIRL